MKNKQSDSSAFSVIIVIIAVIAVLLIVVGAAIVAVQANNKTKLPLVDTTSSAKPGTADSIDQITKQDLESETGVDNAADSGVYSELNSADSAVNNVGGAYDVANY